MHAPENNTYLEVCPGKNIFLHFLITGWFQERVRA